MNEESKKRDSKSQNLTGDQIQDIMDHLLYSALEPFVTHCDVYDHQITYMLSVMSQNKKRKLTYVEREAAFSVMCQILCEQNKEIKFKLIKSLGIERSCVHVFLKKILKEYRENFINSYHKFLTSKSDKEKRRLAFYLDNVVKALGADSRSGAFVALNNAQDSLVLYENFVKSVVFEYEKLCHISANKHIKVNPNNNFDFLDVVQGFMHNIVIALNKYHAGKGALTSHIKWWLLNAQTCNTAEHEYGIAFTIPQGQKKKLATSEHIKEHSVNFSVSLDALLSKDDEEGNDLHNILGSTFNVETHVEKSKQVEKICKLSKCADRLGIGRLSLEIGEYFSKKEKRQMLKIMREQGLA